MKRITLFSFGYWGWGNTTDRLIEIVDAIESARGFAPPIFVDVRISRAVRAKGFNGNAFEKALGSDRYCYMPELGNLFIITKRLPRIQIKDPAAAIDLLDLAVSAASAGRRVIFFCSCKFPFQEGAPKACHRVTVGSHLLKEALKRGRPLEIVEWPGEAPSVLEIPITPKDAQNLLSGAKSIPLDQAAKLGSLAGPAWGSIVKVKNGSGVLNVVVGPARYRQSGWYLPIPWRQPDKRCSLVELQAAVAGWRHEYGFEPRSVL